MSVTFPHAIFEFCSYLSFSHCFTETVLVLLRAGTVSLFGKTLLKNLVMHLMHQLCATEINFHDSLP